MDSVKLLSWSWQRLKSSKFKYDLKVLVEPSSMLRGIRGCLFSLNMCFVGSGFGSGGWLPAMFLPSVCSDSIAAFCYFWSVLRGCGGDCCGDYNAMLRFVITGLC